MIAIQEMTHPRSRIRKAWCELTGGHRNIVLGAFKGEECVAVRLSCERCGKITRWYDIPSRIALPKEKKRK